MIHEDEPYILVIPRSMDLAEVQTEFPGVRVIHEEMIPEVIA